MNTQLDPNEDDAGVLWAEIHRLRDRVAGPPGFSSWQEAATAERVRRVNAERELAAYRSTPADGGGQGVTPLRDDQIATGLDNAITFPTTIETSAFRKGVKFAEAAHGIGTPASTGGERTAQSVVDRLRSLRIVLGVDSPDVRGWAPAIRMEAQRTVDAAIAALTASPRV